jgi:hypothetical protein
MATLTNPIEAQNIIDRFADYVVATANANIVWGTNANPVANTGPTASEVEPIVEVISDSLFGGGTDGLITGQITGNGITPNDNVIDGNVIYTALVAETKRYTRIRNVNAILNVTGAGGNSGTRLRNSGAVPGRERINVFNQTSVAHRTASIEADITIQTAADSRINNGEVISRSNLETFFTNLRSGYNLIRDNAITYTAPEICHASCHSNCHNSRGRR